MPFPCHSVPFHVTDRRKRARHRDHLRQIAPLGGKARAMQLRAARAPVPPYGGTFLDFLLAVDRSGPSRAAWRTFWKVADGLPLEPEEVQTFRLHTGRTTPPTIPAREVWVIAGRRAGKSEGVTARATWRAISKDWTAVLSPGERGVLPIVASDRDQARNTLGYLKGLSHHPLVKPYVLRSLKDAVEFRTGVTVKVATASWKTTRGYTMVDVVLEECAFYSVEGSANPDEEILAAIRPALLTIPGARVYGVSTPYARRGILFKAWEKYWGKDASDVVVWCSDSVSLHPGLDVAEINRAFEDDPAVAASEFGRGGLVQFRSDVQAFISREAVVAVVVPGRLELPRMDDVRTYCGFVDPSGGSQDAFTLAVAHRDREGRAVLDCLREVRPPFSPEATVAEFSATLRSYQLTRVTGDRYAGEWPREQFRKCGIDYQPSEKAKSDIYRELLPIINAGRCQLLDHPKLRGQLLALERRVARGGRDSVDHAPGAHAHDDVANAAAGALVLAAGGTGTKRHYVHDGGIFRLSRPGEARPAEDQLFGDDE